jgi:glutaredoxin 2
MTVTLYHYVHCPFCVRVRLALGYLNIPYNSQVLRYDDESTPVQLTGKKMLPILKTKEGAINESLDIIELLDKENRLKISEIKLNDEFVSLETLLNKMGNPIHSLAMPYWIYTPEFDEKSRAYFQTKKEIKRGPFKELVHRHEEFLAELNPLLSEIEKKLTPYYMSDSLGLYDILIAAHLWGLYIVPEFQFTEKVHEYLQKIKRDCRFNYHQDFWS